MVFNTSANVVLDALEKPVKRGDLHYWTKLMVRKFAVKSTGVSLKDWAKIAKSYRSKASTIDQKGVKIVAEM